jgi:hypothetical protein
MIPSPPIDTRPAAEVVDQLRQLFQKEMPEWARPALDVWPGGDPGAALVEIFARFAEVTIERLNRAPDKHFLAFLEMLGVTLLAPVEARAPVQFFVAKGASAEILVRGETPLATAGATPQSFETERDLWVHPARLVRALTFDPRNDRYTDHTMHIGTAGLSSAETFSAFVGGTLLDHILYMGHDGMLGGSRPARAGIRVSLVDARDREPAVLSVLGSLSFWARAAGEPAHLAPAAMAVGTFLEGRFTKDDENARTLHASNDAELDALAPGDVVFAPFRGAFRVAAVQGLSITVTSDLPTDFGDRSVELLRVDALRLAGAVHSRGETSKVLTGVGTRFLSELARGDVVYLPKVGLRTVKAVISNTEFEASEDVTLASSDGVVAWLRLREPSEEAVALIELSGIAGIEPWTLGGITARWLWAKTEQPLLGEAADFPAADRVTLNAASSAPIHSDAVFANGSAIDATAGGFPFGERPRLGDAVYFCSRDAFSKPGALVTIEAEVAFPRNEDDAPPPVSLAWEFWDGNAWKALGTSTQNPGEAPTGNYQFRDETQAFTQSGTGSIRFECPPCGLGTVGSVEGLWIRARISSGSYGEEAKLTTQVAPQESLADWVYQPPTFRPPFVSGVTLAYEYEEAEEAQQLLVQNAFSLAPVKLNETDGRPNAPFAPFPPPEDAEPVLAFGWDAAFANHPVSLYVATAEQSEPPQNPEVRWQYWNGEAWERLALIRDGTKSLTEPGALEFVGTTGLARSPQLGSELFWIRGQLNQGEAPRFALSGLLPNTTWARHAVTVRDELVGSSNGKPNQVFTASRTPVLGGQKLEVRELEVPPAGELAALAAEGEADPVRLVTDETGRTLETWVRWHEVNHFQLSGPDSRHYVVDRASGRLIMGDGRRGRIPAPGRDNIRLAEYRAGGGTAGNVAAGEISVLKRAVPSIDRVTNPFASGGGADLEDVESAKDRGPLLLRHRDRAVTAEDYEALARAASRQVARAKCISARNAATAGRVSILIVPAEGPRPLPTPGLLRLVKSFLDARRTPTADLSLFGPTYVDVSVSAVVVPVSFDDADVIRQRVDDALTAWLHPLFGGPDSEGWDFGRGVFLSEVAAAIEAVEGVDHVARMSIAGRAGADDRTRDNGQRVEVHEDGELVASGTHTILLGTA